jgi:hypothetical protein
VLSSNDVEHNLEYNFHNYAESVIKLEHIWNKLGVGIAKQTTELIKDEIPEEIEKKDKETLRLIEGLLHILWFKPPFQQLEPAKRVHEELSLDPNPTEKTQTILPYLTDLIKNLHNVIERAKYLKWKSVIDRKDFSKSGIFEGLELSNMAKEAFAVALDDILREHTLAYIGYPERATWIGKAMRIIFGLAVLPARIVVSFLEAIKRRIFKKKPDEEETEPDADQKIKEENTSSSATDIETQT